MCWVQLMTSTIQFLCISISETWLQVTLKRREEILADLFARLLRYFQSSCKNLTIRGNYSQQRGARQYFKYRFFINGGSPTTPQAETQQNMAIIEPVGVRERMLRGE